MHKIYLRILFKFKKEISVIVINNTDFVIYLSYIKGVIFLAEFCTCGSIVFNGHCSNKNCINKTSAKTTPAKASKKAAGAASKEVKAPKTKRASKCITYNLYDINKEEENVT